MSVLLGGIADEQITLEDRPPVLREGRTEQREIRTQCVEQRLGDRSDIAGIGRIEGRAVFEEDLARPGAAQKAERGKAHRHRLFGRDRAAFEGDDDRLSIGQLHIGCRHVDQLHGAHAAPHQRVAEIGRAGEIVGDRSQQYAHDALPLRPLGRPSAAHRLLC